MIRKQKLYSRPRKAYELERMKEENELVKEYGLKNKKEIWKMDAKVDYFRKRAKDLAKASREEQQVLFTKLQNLGLNTNSIADVLALTIQDLLKRRLQTVVAAKGLARTPRQARQLITHKKILVNKALVNSPSYLVPVSEEKSISIKAVAKKAKTKAETPAAEVKSEPATEAAK